MKRSELIFAVKAFVIWMLGLLIILFFAVKLLPVQKNFLGGGYNNYLKAPVFWALGNFDGEHYVSIASSGYGFGEHAFFPVYPVIVRTLGNFFGATQISYYASGIFVSLSAFLLGLLGFYKLLRLDFNEKLSQLAVVLLLVFPTSFYFAAVYTESLFFALAVWSFYMARKKMWTYAAVFGIILTATRFVGLIIFPALLVEWYVQNRKSKNLLKIFPTILLSIPTGLLGYMYYLDRTIHNKLAFYGELSMFGEQRSSHPILLPQVIYRYVFKILPGLKTIYFPVIYSTILEFAIGCLFFAASIWAFFKTRLSYALFLALGYIIPTLSGSFSSLPRYVLVLFPVYILLAGILNGRKKYLFAFLSISTILLVVSLALFGRGYWIS